MTISENIKKIRKEKNISQKDLAKRLNTSPQNLAQYENGKRKPKIETLEKIANALGVNITDLSDIPRKLSETEQSHKIIKEAEKNLRKETSFCDYLKALGYVIGDSEYTDHQLHVLETDSYIHLDADDMKIIEELESSTERDIKRTLNLLISAKNK